MRDRSRPHKFPASAIGEEVIAWKCAACDEWISEYHYDEQEPCAVDWRRPHRWRELERAIVAVIRRG